MSSVQFCPLAAHGAWSALDTPSCVAPPFARSAAVALPCWIFDTRLLLVVVGFGSRHTLASYVSMHTVPDTTESGEQFFSGFAPCAQTVPASSMTAAGTMILRTAGPITGLLSSPDGVRTVAPLSRRRTEHTTEPRAVSTGFSFLGRLLQTVGVRTTSVVSLNDINGTTYRY